MLTFAIVFFLLYITSSSIELHSVLVVFVCQAFSFYLSRCFFLLFRVAFFLIYHRVWSELSIVLVKILACFIHFLIQTYFSKHISFSNRFLSTIFRSVFFSIFFKMRKKINRISSFCSNNQIEEKRFQTNEHRVCDSFTKLLVDGFVIAKNEMNEKSSSSSGNSNTNKQQIQSSLSMR